MQLQVKIVIGTIAFMLTMVILGFAALREPARMEEYTAAFDGRSMENGADIFTNTCTTCHGVNGKAEQCFDASGEQIGCKGLPLNNADLLCGAKSPRMEAMGWSGTKESFIQSTVASGRPWNGMPTWGTDFGGPLQNNQVHDVTLFVLNWESEDLCGEAAQAPAVEWPASVAELPQGNPDNAQQLFEITYGCAGCHGNLNDPNSAAVGPWLGEIAQAAGGRKDGYTAADYVYESILHPSEFIAPECPNGPCSGPPSAMPANFSQRMTPQDLADIISYLLGTTEFESTTEITPP